MWSYINLEYSIDTGVINVHYQLKCVWLSKLVGVSSDIVSLVVSRPTYRDTYRIVARRIVTPLGIAGV